MFETVQRITYGVISDNVVTKAIQGRIGCSNYHIYKPHEKVALQVATCLALIGLGYFSGYLFAYKVGGTLAGHVYFQGGVFASLGLLMGSILTTIDNINFENKVDKATQFTIDKVCFNGDIDFYMTAIQRNNQFVRRGDCLITNLKNFLNPNNRAQSKNVFIELIISQIGRICFQEASRTNEKSDPSIVEKVDAIENLLWQTVYQYASPYAVGMLMKAKFSPNILFTKSTEYCFPLFLSVCSGDVEVVKILVEAGANIFFNHKRFTILNALAELEDQAKKMEILKILIGALEKEPKDVSPITPKALNEGLILKELKKNLLAIENKESVVEQKEEKKGSSTEMRKESKENCNSSDTPPLLITRELRNRGFLRLQN